MSRTLLNTAKSTTTLLFCAGFLLTTIGFLMKESVIYPLQAICVAPQAYVEIDDRDNWTMARGIYRFYREGLTQARIVYTGTISHYVNGNAPAHPIAVLREVTVEKALSGNSLRSTVLEQSRLLGDQSSNADVVNYIFPHIVAGKSHISWLYLLNGVALASGTETTPRTLCIN